MSSSAPPTLPPLHFHYTRPGVPPCDVYDVQLAGPLLLLFARSRDATTPTDHVYAYHTKTGIHRELSAPGLTHYALHGVFLTAQDENGVNALYDLRVLFAPAVDARDRRNFYYYPELSDDIQRIVCADRAVVVLLADGRVFYYGCAPAITHNADVPGPATNFPAQEVVVTGVRAADDPVMGEDDYEYADFQRLPCPVPVSDIAVMGRYLLLGLRDYHGVAVFGLTGGLFASDYQALRPLLTLPATVTRLAASEQHVIVCADKTYGFGSNMNGELGAGDNDGERVMDGLRVLDPAPARQIVAVDGATVLVRPDGTMRVTKPLLAGAGYPLREVPLPLTDENEELRDAIKRRVARVSFGPSGIVAISDDHYVFMVGYVAPGVLRRQLVRMRELLTE